MKVSDLLISALRQCGAIQKQETPPADEMNDAMLAANIMLDAWSGENLMMIASVLENFPILEGISSYTIGIGQTFNTLKPFDITDAFIRDDNNLDYPLDIIGAEQWDSFVDKDSTISMPESLFYDRGVSQQASQTGTINIYYTPDKSYTLFIREQKALTQLVNLSDNFTFEGPYERAFKFNLAVEMWAEYHGSVPLPLHIGRIAEISKTLIKRMNKQQYIATTDLPGRKGVYNIMTDRWS